MGEKGALLGATRTVPRFRFPSIRTCLAFCALLIVLWYSHTQKTASRGVANNLNLCQPPKPNLLGLYPPPENDKEFFFPSQTLHGYLSTFARKSDIDSLAVAVVTPAGTVFEHGYGALRANETDSNRRGQVNRDSIYRIASITTVFTVLETLILRERGALNWDDPVEMHLPDVTYPSYGWSEYLNGFEHNVVYSQPRITLRQLASHLSGVGRDYPPIELNNWPDKHPWAANDSSDAVPRRSYETLLRSIAKYPLINEPYLYPIYSNSGFDLLGLVNVAANRKASDNPDAEPDSHRELVQRDIFDPIGLNSSFYRVPSDPLLSSRIAVPSQTADWADYVFDDSDDPARGQYSSLADLVNVMRTFLSPTAERSLIPQQVVREWLRPLHTWESWVGTFESSGAPWEILKAGDRRLYTKGGNLPGYHTEFAIHQELSFGVVVLSTGTFTDASTIIQEITSLYQPAFDNILKRYMSELYEGTWITGRTGEIAVVKLIAGALSITRLFVRGVDVLALIQNGKAKKSEPVTLWSTGRFGEFRLAFGRKELNQNPLMGCFPYWTSIDEGYNSRGAPIDLIYWDGDTLAYPSAGVRFQRA